LGGCRCILISGVLRPVFELKTSMPSIVEE
jgi:hypothetical protein